MSLLESMKGGLVVSCQAYPGEPMLDPRTMAQVAQAAVAGGAVGIRGKGLDDLRAMRERVAVPIIGLVKVGQPVRVTVDADNEKLGAKIRKAQLEKVPFMLVVGGRDAEAGVVSVRSREAGDKGAMSLEAFMELFSAALKA